MKIAHYEIAMVGDRSYIEKYEKKESLRMWVNNRQSSNTRNTTMGDKIKISDKARKAAQLKENNIYKTADANLTAKDRLTIAIIEILTGKKIKIFRLDFNENNEFFIPDKNQILSDSQRSGWGIAYDLNESYHESEQMTFEAEGVIKTSEGKELKFSASIHMNREFMIKNNIRLRMGDAKAIDPLVINFSNTGVQLTDKKFLFDLDLDGKEDLISFSANGGFLVLDKNNDGIINNGSELFGPSTGDGFSELAKYDSDGNNWIDESDIAFYNLKIWVKDLEGNDIFYTLKDKNIGALYLSSINAEFDIKDSKNTLHGKARRAGIYIKEDGIAGTIQQIDLTT